MHRILHKRPSKPASICGFERTVQGVLCRPLYRGYVEEKKKAGRKTLRDRYEGPLVISGISGRFPNASTLKELTSKMLEGKELISETSLRWHNDRLPQRFGFVNCLDKFDPGFFGITPNQAHLLDPQTRLLLEVCVEALVDAGVNPTGFRGSRTAVFCGAYGGEAMNYFQMRPDRDTAVHQYASHSFMIPARLAFHLDLTGPSSHVSTACSSSFTALQAAVRSIQSDDCDAAIVTGSTLHLSPTSHLHLLALNALAVDGRCKTYDESGDGFGRAEAVVAVVIQKEKEALRNYARILSIRSITDGFKDAGVLHPKRESQVKLLNECYAEAGIDPQHVSYVEAHGTGTPSGDPEELHALHSVFCQAAEGRERPLQVGSIKTYIGHTEGAAGLCGISKIVGAIQTGIIPANLNFNKPSEKIKHLLDGSLKVVTEPTAFDRGVVGVSSFGIGGTNYHLVLQPGPVSKIEPNKDLPVLLQLSGRSEAQVRQSLEEASKAAMNPEFVHLVHKAYNRHIPEHSFRGTALVQPGQSSGEISVKWCETINRSVWVVFPGMGSQHNQMGRILMKVDPFEESIKRSRATLVNVGLHTDEIFHPENERIFTDIHHAFVAITTVQIALWDTLRSLGIQPDGFIGHSFGEFMCAYADGCLSAEETLLLADARGRAFKESRKVIGGMASIAMSPEEVKPRLPPGVELACFNAAQNVTVSGELAAVTKFVEEIKTQGTMATMVNSCGFAAHSKYVQDAGDLLKKYMKDIVIGSRPRSPRWISTSIPESEWDSHLAQSCSAEYFDGNVRNPVYFYQAVQQIPSGSLVIEVSPKGFFKGLLSETVPSDCIHVAPMTLKAEKKLDHFFQSISEIYLSGVEVHMDNLYAPVTTPVSSNTPSLSHLVQWDHSKSWKTCMLDYPLGYKYESIVHLDHLNHMYLDGHKIEDRILLPATHILHSIWMQFAEMIGRHFESLPVQITDVSFKRATILNEKSETRLLYAVNVSTGAFEVENQGEIVATGTIATLPEDHQWPDVREVESSSYLPLNKDQVYKAFRLRGYNYTGLFQGIENIDNEGRWADVTWGGNWTAFLDTVLQTALLTTTTDHLLVPVDIQQLNIDPLEVLKNLEQGTLVRVVNLPNTSRIFTPGVEIASLNTATVPRKIHTPNLIYESFSFCPLNELSGRKSEYHFQELVDLVLENQPNSIPLNVVDIFAKQENSLASAYAQVESLKPNKRSQIRMVTLSDQVKLMEESSYAGRVLEAKENMNELLPDSAADLVLLDDPSLLSAVGDKMKAQSFVIVHSTQADLPALDNLTLISQKKLVQSTMSLLRKKCEEFGDNVHISVDEVGFKWLTKLQEAIGSTVTKQTRIYVTSQGTPKSGILGLMRCLRIEDEGWNVRGIYDPEGKLELDFKQPDSRLQSILQADLGLNVWQDDQPGTYRHITLDHDALAKKTLAQDAYVGTLTPGDLSSLSWIQLPNMNWSEDSNLQCNQKSVPHKQPYQVACSALNFRDVLLATGTIPMLPEYSYSGQYLGFEFSGIDEQGNRVMGIAEGNGLASYVHANPQFVWAIPNHWTFEQAATVPLVYGTVLHAFYTKANIKAGQTVLIHAGSGGVGQAAIRVALANNCKVLTTVGSNEKRQFVKKMFPQLTDEHIGCSRNTSFERQFMELTSGRGVDIILNSLAGDKLQASLRCLAVGGKFLEIGVFDAYMNTKIGMRPLLKSVEIIGVELLHLMQLSDDSGIIEFRKLMDDGIGSGAVSPLPAHTFPKEDMEEAFRFMANGRHVGKLVIKLKEEDSLDTPLNISAVKRSYFHPEKSYVVVGGLGGLGLELVNWLIERGARRLVVTSRSGISNGYQSYCMRKWLAAGADVQVANIDLSAVNLAEDFILELSRKSNVGGVFNAALVLQDEPFLKQSVESFTEVSRPKEDVTVNLDNISRKHGLQLDYFVCFSSIACGRGSIEQTNYGWTNSVIERVCESRAKDGLHGLAIQYGFIGKVGFVSDMMKGKEMTAGFEMLGVKSQSVESCLQVLDAALQQDIPVVSSMVTAEKGITKEERAGLVSQVEKIFGIDNLKSAGVDKKLSELGMDSLIAVELRQALEREFEITVTKENLRLLTVGHIFAIADGTFDVKTIGKAIEKKGGSDVNVPWMIHEKPLELLRSHPSNRQVFIVHGSDGGSNLFKPLARRLNANVFAFQFTGMGETSSVQELAAFYVKKLKEIQPEGPYTIMGYSIGAPIAFTMAQQLHENGDKVENLVFLDGCPCYSTATLDAKRLFSLLLIQSMNIVRDLPPDEMTALADSLKGNAENDLKLILNVIKLPAGFKLEEDQAKQYGKLINTVGDYKPVGMYSGNVTLLEALEPSTHNQVVPSEDYELSKFCNGKVGRHQVRGSHWTFFDESNISDKADIINRIIE